jgi:hypothetical protein
MTSPNLLDEESSDEESDGSSDEDRDRYSDDDSDEHNSEHKKRDDQQVKTHTFPQFGELPVEIQMMIWDYTLPHPREVPDAILVFVNFDLNRPRAIILSLDYIMGLHDDITNRNENIYIEYDPELLNKLGLILRDTVITLLHTCHNSRALAGGVFSLDMEGSSAGWNTNLWDPTRDTLYLAGMAYEDGDHCFLRWLANRRHRPYIGLKSAAHVALKLNLPFMQATKLIDVDPEAEFQYFDDIGYRWLVNIPSLQTLTLCIDPLLLGERLCGQVVPYPPLDVPIRNLGLWRPLTIQQDLQEMFLEEEKMSPSLQAPLVEVSVLCWRDSSRSRMDSLRG